MKMKPADAAKLAEALAPLDTMALRDRYRRGDFPNATKVIDLNRRYRWDLWWATPYTVRDEIIANLGPNPKDTWIETALRNLVAPL